MSESDKFLRALVHTNPHRPTFEIGEGVDTQLRITFKGQTMEVPISEILNFARRWEADHKAQQALPTRTTLNIYPYPVYGTRMDDPDCLKVGWWVEPDGRTE